MMPRRRELRSVDTETVLGAVVVRDDGSVEFDRSAQNVFAPLRRRASDREVAELLMRDGWSNGYLYLADEQ